MNEIQLKLSIKLSGAIDPDDLARYIKEEITWCPQAGSDLMDLGLKEIISDQIMSDPSLIKCEVYRVIQTT